MLDLDFYIEQLYCNDMCSNLKIIYYILTAIIHKSLEIKVSDQNIEQRNGESTSKNISDHPNLELNQATHTRYFNTSQHSNVTNQDLKELLSQVSLTIRENNKRNKTDSVQDSKILASNFKEIRKDHLSTQDQKDTKKSDPTEKTPKTKQPKVTESKITQIYARRFYTRAIQRPNAKHELKKDPKIERLLEEYRALMNKYGSSLQATKPEDVEDPPHGPKQELDVNPFSNPKARQFFENQRDPGFRPNASAQYSAYWSQKRPFRQGPVDPAGPKGLPPAGLEDPDSREMAQGPRPNMTQLPHIMTHPTMELTTPDPKKGDAAGAATRFSTRRTTTRRVRRTTPHRVSLAEDCDYLAYYCLKAYNTGKVCGRTMFFKHFTFENYCLLDYVNCMERYDIWQVAHMGECITIKLLSEYLHYPYNDDYFLDNYYIIEDM